MKVLPDAWLRSQTEILVRKFYFVPRSLFSGLVVWVARHCNDWKEYSVYVSDFFKSNLWKSVRILYMWFSEKKIIIQSSFFKSCAMLFWERNISIRKNENRVKRWNVPLIFPMASVSTSKHVLRTVSHATRVQRDPGMHATCGYVTLAGKLKYSARSWQRDGMQLPQ